MIAFDDIDVLVPSVSNVTSMFQVRLETYFLQEVRRRNALATGTVFVGIVGTSQLRLLNMEVCCTGLLDRVIRIPRLTKQRRLAILRLLLKCTAVTEEVLEWLCEQTASYSAADLSSFCSSLTERVFALPRSEVTPVLCQPFLDSIFPSSSREFHAVKPLDGGFDALFGIDATIARVKETILRPLLHPEVYRMYNLQPPSGALFYGPSGTGKSAMIQAIAAETKNQIQVIEVACSDILGKVGMEATVDSSIWETPRRSCTTCSHRPGWLRRAFCSWTTLRIWRKCVDRTRVRRSERGWALPFRTFDRLLSCLLTELDGLYSNVRMGVFSDRAAKSECDGDRQHARNEEPRSLHSASRSTRGAHRLFRSHSCDAEGDTDFDVA